MKIIELKNLKKTYYLGKLDVPVLRGIDLEIMQGEFVAIMGYSGSGKSTLLNILGLLDKQTEGSYKLAGVEISNYSDSELAALRNHYLGFIFQQFNLLPKLTVLENVALPLMYANSKDEKAHEDPTKLLDMVGLSERISHHPSEISGGQQQRVAVARSLTNKPLIIFADEPTGNLDTKSTKDIIKILKDLNNAGITIVMVTHEPELAAYATRVIRMQDGVIVSDEKTADKSSASKQQSVRQFKHKTFSLQRIKDYFIQALRTIVGSKIRSMLSVLGVTMGVASLIALLAIGEGIKNGIENQLGDLGSNVLRILPGVTKKGDRMRFKIEDIDDLKKNIPGIKYIAGCNRYYGARVVANGNNHNPCLEGVSASYADMQTLHPSIGRFFTEEENNERKKVVLLGEEVVEKIYKDKKYNPLGEYVKINKIDFQVIGVLPAKGSGAYGNEDDRVIIPLNTASYRIFGDRRPSWVFVQVEDNADMDKVSDAVKKRLLFMHRMPPSEKDAVKVGNMEDVRKKVASITAGFSIFLGSVAIITLLVGGMGIMNIMFVSVSERTKEIGLRKAIGASNTDILFQFTVEAVFICCIGGIIGILLGSRAAMIAGEFIKSSPRLLAMKINPAITPFSVVLAFSFSVFTGLVFGILPARKASLLSPMEALRHD
ncbi:macrolide export ATP-binding/permease protein MacB [Endomicrobiia bacterium]|nr:macrolide export ATP-binding/permease protein MacB [Endomicrobiia bacterium]